MSMVIYWLYFIFHPVRPSSCSMQSFNKKRQINKLYFPLRDFYCLLIFIIHSDIPVLNSSRLDPDSDGDAAFCSIWIWVSTAWQSLFLGMLETITVMIRRFRTDIWANSADPDQRSSLIRVYTVCHFVCIVWTHYSKVEPHGSNVRVITTNVLGVWIFRKFTVVLNCLADHGQTIQSLAKCGSCHCIFRLLQTFLPLFSWKMIVNLNNPSGSQYLTEWLLIYFSDEIVRFFYCKTNHRSQQPHKSANKIICAIISACYLHLSKTEYVLWLAVNKFSKTERRKKNCLFRLLQNPVFKNDLKTWVSFLENSGMLWMVNDATSDAIVWHYTYKCR